MFGYKKDFPFGLEYSNGLRGGGYQMAFIGDYFHWTSEASASCSFQCKVGLKGQGGDGTLLASSPSQA